MKDNRTPAALFQDLDTAAHFKPGSARYVPDETPWIHRWENEGGKTVAATLPEDRAPSPHYFYPTRPLLTQPI